MKIQSRIRLVFVAGIVILAGALAVSVGAAQERPADAGNTRVQTILDIPYAGTDNPRQCLDLFLPKDRQSKDPLPVIVFIHGGGWRNGNKRSGRGRVGPLVESGQYAGVSVGYRLSGEAQWPAQIHDCKAAIRWIRANAQTHDLDPKRIGVWGTSAGGHLVAMLGTSAGVPAMDGDLGPHTKLSTRVTCVVDFFGPTDFLQMDAQRVPGSKLTHDRPDSPESLLVGGAIQSHPDRVATANPITYVSVDDPPFLIMHGDDDRLVPIHQSALLNKALRQTGVDVTFVSLPGAGHGLRGADTADQVMAFLDRHLSQDKKPNIIVVFTDDHGYADLSCQGILNDVKTPHIDSLAQGGVRMTSGYVTASQCVPSRAGLLTGKYQQRFGLESNGDALNGFNRERTIAERLKQAGYATGMIGKWHLGPANKITEHGFDDVFYKNSNRDGWANYDLRGKDLEGGPEKSGLYHLDACSKAARAFITRHHKKPFFLYLAYRAPHVPLDATPDYLNRFTDPMPERRRKALAMLSAVDDGVGGLLASLREYAIEDNTLIFFIGDNGAPVEIHKLDAPGIGAGWDGSLNDPLNGEKGTVLEGGNRVPFLAYWKGHIPARVYHHPVISLDVAATATALAGLKTDPQLDGVNLLPYLTGDNTGQPHEALYWRWAGQAAVRQGKWKYIRGGSRRYLFDLETDIAEKHNVVDKHPEVAKRLASGWQRWSHGLKPPGLEPTLAQAGSRYFDFYLDGKPASHPKFPGPKTGTRQAAVSRGKRPTGAALLKKRDRNQDGRLTLKEYIGNPTGRNVPALTRQFEARDRDGDGYVTASELDARGK